MRIDKVKGKVDGKYVVLAEVHEDELALLDIALKKEQTFVNRSWEKSTPTTPEEAMYWVGRRDAVNQLRKDIGNMNKRFNK